MSSAQPQETALDGSGFVAAILDIPFPITLPNDTYACYDPKKGIAGVQTLLKEGSRAFFRNSPIKGPTSFEELTQASKQHERPRTDYSYVAVANLANGERKASLNIHSGSDGGFAEAKYYSEIHVTFLEDDLRRIATEGYVMARVAEILGPFLDKYRLFTLDYRVGQVSIDRNFYLAVCHTSPLTPEESVLNPQELFARLEQPRTFYVQLGHGAVNVIRLNNLDHLLPWPQMPNILLATFGEFVKEPYDLPLSYDLILEALRSMQIARDFKLAIVHAATAVEVHVLNLLNEVLILSGSTSKDAWSLLENDSNYQGVKNRVKRLEEKTREYCANNALTFSPFLGGNLYRRWETDVCTKRNRAVHAGVASYKFQEASDAIGIAKETIAFLDNRIPALANRIQLDASMAKYRESGAGILF